MSEMAQERTANVVLTADVDPYRQSIQAAGQDTSRLTTGIDKLTKSLDNLAKSAGKKLTFFGLGSTASITATTAAFASFDKQMTALKVNAEVTGRSYEKMTRGVSDLRKEFGIATSAAVALNKTVLGFKDNSAPVDKLTKTFVRLGAAVGEAPEAMAQSMLQLQRSMGTPQRDTERYANVLTDLSVKSGVAASSIMEFSQVIAPIGRIAGMQQAEIMGISTAFNKAGQDGYLAANAFNKMLSDIMRSTQDGSPDLARYANLIGVTVGQFKEMNKTDAITQIFDELNRMGPNAIQILNRMGLDGMRMQRAIAGVSQQSGGIGTAVSQAVAAYNAGGDNALKKGSEVALDGVADRMNRLAESTKKMGEAMGSAFGGPAKIFLSTMAGIVETLSQLAGSTGGKVLAWFGALAGVAALAGGPLLKMAGALATLATARGLTTNWLTSGFKDGRAMREGGSGMLTATGRSFAANPEGTNFAQRGFYRLGEALGARSPFGPLQTLIAGGARGGAIGADFMRGIYAPLTHPFNSMNRPRIFATTEERAAGRGFGPGGFISGSIARGAASTDWRGSWAQARSGNFGGAAANLWTSGMGQAGRLFPPPPLLSSPGRELGNFGLRAAGLVGTIGGAAIGTGAVGAQLGFRGLQAGIGALGTGIASLGPLGAMMIGLPLAMAAKQKMTAANDLTVGAGEDNISLMDSYKAAVGEATSATLDFATALRNSTPDTPGTKEQALLVTESDKIRAAQMDKLSNAKLENASYAQAGNLLRGELRGDASPAVIQEMKIDLIKRFGADRAEALISQANGRGSFSTGSYLREINRMNDRSGENWFGAKAAEGAQDQYDLLEGQFKSIRGGALGRGGSAAGGETQKVLTNQFLSSFFGGYGDLTMGGRDAGFSFINKVLFGGKMDIGDEGNQIAANSLNKLVDYRQFAVDASDVGSAFKKGRVPGLQEFYGQMANSDHEGTKEAFDTFIGNFGLNRKTALAQIESGKGSLFNTTMDTAKLLMGSNVTAAEAFQKRIYSSEAGQIFKDSPKTMDLINRAIQSPGDQNLQIQAVDQMVSTMKKAGAGFGEIDRMLILFQGALQDTSDPLYQLAQAARAVSSQQMQFKLPYMGTADQFGMVGMGFTSQMDALTPREGQALPGDAEQQRKEAKQNFESYKLQTRNQLMGLIQQQREFDIAKERSNYDFYQVQLPRMEEQYNLSRSRAWEDYNISRTRSETEFNISRARSQQQFALSMKDSYFDYHLSRKRAEQDFAHQQVLLARQAAQGMYDVYQRTMVQRTWAGPSLLQNSEDQLRRMREQNDNLAKVRQMGLSKNAIQQLGFTDAANAQQLDRFIEDAMRNPALVQKFNQNANRRLKQGKQLATDPANPQWEEMRRQFSLTMNRGEEDFERAMSRNRRNYRISMKQSQEDFGRAMDNNATDMKRAMSRSAQDYATSLSHMKEDYSRQQERAAKDLRRMQRELTWSFEETLEKAVKKLGGSAGEMAQQIYDTWQAIKAFFKSNEIEIYVNWKNSPGMTRFTDPMDRHGLGEGGNRRASASGGLFMGSQPLTVGEAGPELLLPLNNQGAHFAAALLNRFSSEAKMTQVSGRGMPISGGSVNNYRIDKSTNFTGPVQVSGVENPRQLAEKARQEARRKRLVQGVRHK